MKDRRATAGKQVFEREQCSRCHTLPGVHEQQAHAGHWIHSAPGPPAAADIMPISVDTDPSLALKTRKGTGFYKVPSLKGVWYRGLFNHDGSVTSLEEWFDPTRRRDDFVPSGHAWTILLRMA
jgi:cytochrome c peroxidase